MCKQSARKVYLFTIVLCCPFFGISQDSTGIQYTLKQCVDSAIANNLQVRQSDLQMQTNEINWKQAKANMLPSISAFADHGINEGRNIDPSTNTFINQQINFASYGLNAGVRVFGGLVLENSIKQNSLAYQAAKMDLQQNKDLMTLNVILAYLQVLSNADLLTQSINQVEVSKKQVERLEILNKDGAIPPSQLSDLKGDLANAQLTVISNQNALESSKIALCQLMNIDYKPQMQLEQLNADQFHPSYDATPDKIYDISLQQLALVKAAELRERSAVKGLKVAKGNYYPVLSLTASANTNYSSATFESIFQNTTDVTSKNYVLIGGTPNFLITPENNFLSQKVSYSNQLNNNLYNSVSLNLNIPLFNSFLTRNRVKLARIQLKNNEYVTQTTKIQLKQSIEQAWVNMTSSIDRYKTLTGQLAAYAESFRSAEIRFNEGVITSVDYVIAKNNLDRTNINLITARYDYILRTKVLDYYQNKPLW
ncbi:MAG TPA: TolC family protein [Chitinophagaceae bacterium]|jgi:outer membrane protein